MYICMYITITYYINIIYYHIIASCQVVSRRVVSYCIGGSWPRLALDEDLIRREFKDVVFEDVLFDNNSFVTLLDIVCYCNIYAKAIIIKHPILKHRILELPNTRSSSSSSSSSY